MLAKHLLLVVLLWTVSGDADTQLEQLSISESTEKSLAKNLFGQCTVSKVKDIMSLESSESNLENRRESDYRIIEISPTEAEISAYQAVPVTYTKTNPSLAVGPVKQVSKATVWLNQAISSWQLDEDHPRSNRSNCLRVTDASNKGPIAIYEAYKKDVTQYLLYTEEAMITDMGIVGKSCGYFQAIEACETVFKFIGRKWWNSCTQALNSHNKSWLHLHSPATAQSLNATICTERKGQIPSYHRRVFVVTATWDNNYHHFIIDTLSRLIRHIEFLKNNQDVMIHIRRFEQYAKKPRYVEGGRKLRQRLIELLGLSTERFINGPVLAEKVYIPRAVKCNYPIAHAYQIR